MAHEKVEARLEKLEAALKPFAKMARDTPKSARPRNEPVVGVFIPWKLLDAAAEAIKDSHHGAT